MVREQVQRLVPVLSVPAVTRGALLTDGAPDLATGLPPADAAVLRAAGWTPENGLRSLLNFSGAFWLSYCVMQHPHTVVIFGALECIGNMQVWR